MHKMLKKVCRICGKYASIKKSVILFDGNRKVLGLIQTLTGILIEQHSSWPERICECCYTELEQANRWRQRCITSQIKFLNALTESERQEISESYKAAVLGATTRPAQQEVLPPESIKSEESDPIEEEFVEEFQIEPQSETEYEIVRKEDLDEADAENADAETIEFAEASFEYDSNDEEALLDNVLDDELDTAEISSSKKLRVEERKSKKSKSQVGRPTSQGNFICDQCGNLINGRMAFDLHLRRHRGDKQFQCEICQDRFCTTSELKRHMRRHTGERPFPCQYCDRRFTDYSTRLKHERTHTNERPYGCPSCGKAFTTAYILKNHMLVHSGERAFRCDLCDKSFMRNTHLATHFRSTVHKRNLEKQVEQTLILSDLT